MVWAVWAADESAEVVTVRPSRLLQVGAPVSMLLFVPAWLTLGVLSHDGSDLSGDVPVLAALLVVAFVAAVVAVRRPVLTFTPDRLIMRSLASSRAWRWDEIMAVTPIGSRVFITTVDGTFALPISSSRRVTLAGTSLPLADATASAWFAGRGPSWFPVPLSPWQPTCDVKGNVVLRVPIRARLVRLLTNESTVVAVFLLMPSAPLGSKVIFLLPAVVIAVTAVWGYGRWTGVVVSPEALEVRDWRGRRSISRAHVSALVEASRSLPLGRPPGGILELWLVTGERVRLPAPMTGLYDNDPEYYRKWAWLDRELAAPVASPPPPVSTTAPLG